MKRRAFVVCLLLALAIDGMLLNPGRAQAKSYRVGILDFPPFAVIEKSGRYSGIMVEVMKKVLKKAGIAYTMTPVPQKRLFKSLATGDTDICMGIKGVPVYEGKVLFSSFPVSEIDLRVYARKGTKMIEDKADFRGTSVIVIMGYGYGGLIQYLQHPANDVSLDPTPTHVLAFRKLRANRSEYVLDYRQPASLSIQKEAMEKEVISRSLAKLNIYFIVSQKTPGAKELMKRLEIAYETLKAEGKLSNQ